MSDNPHASWDAKTLNHPEKATGYGCLWRHALPNGPGWASHPCNHAVNGYNVSLGSRSDLYNKDHQKIARALKLVAPDFGLSSRGTKWVWKRFPTSTGDSSRKSTVGDYLRRARQSLSWLGRGKEGWHIGVSHLSPTPNQPLKKGSRPHFQPRQSAVLGGYGSFYPYEHNYHHLIPIGAVETWVVGNGSPESPTRSEQVIKLILFSRWNIHNEKNMMLLPQQQFESRIIGLPAHCPWGYPAHAAYQNSLKARLRDLREQIDRSLGEKKHPKNIKTMITNELDELSESLLEQVKSMRPGEQLTKVNV